MFHTVEIGFVFVEMLRIIKSKMLLRRFDFKCGHPWIFINYSDVQTVVRIVRNQYDPGSVRGVTFSRLFEKTLQTKKFDSLLLVITLRFILLFVFRFLSKKINRNKNVRYESRNDSIVSSKVVPLSSIFFFKEPRCDLIKSARKISSYLSKDENGCSLIRYNQPFRFFENDKY